MEQQDKTRQLIKLLQEFKTETINGAVIFHMNKQTRQVESISPLLQFESTQDMFNQLSRVRDTIQHFLNELVDKGLCHN